MSTRFQTLLHREWMQHHRGWLLSMLILPVLFLLVLPFSSSSITPESEHIGSTQLALAAASITIVAVFAANWIVMALQLPGLPRRDTQDRSIEFWLSLPGTHLESVSAPLLTHAILVPTLAVLVGASVSLPMALAVVVKQSGWMAAAAVNWGAVLTLALAISARMALGIVLFSLWLAPIYLIFMVASAWLKRWGIPATIAAWIILGNVLEKIYNNPIVWRLTSAQFEGAGHALLIAQDRDPQHLITGAGQQGYASNAWSWLVQDSMDALSQLASMHLIGGLLIAALGMGLLIVHRQRAH